MKTTKTGGDTRHAVAAINPDGVVPHFTSESLSDTGVVRFQRADSARRTQFTNAILRNAMGVVPDEIPALGAGPLEPASDATTSMVKGWLAQHNGDVEALARWMRDSLRIGGLRTCRELIAQVLA